MNERELKDTLMLLEAAGVRAALCNAAVPVSTAAAVCGAPRELGDDSIEDYVLLPKVLVGPHPEIFIPAIGDSMRDAGYEEGDMLRVRLGLTGHDGEDVLVLIDGACTVKTLFTEEDGQKWLVPQNESYQAFPLSDEMNVRILGENHGVGSTDHF